MIYTNIPSKKLGTCSTAIFCFDISASGTQSLRTNTTLRSQKLTDTNNILIKMFQNGKRLLENQLLTQGEHVHFRPQSEQLLSNYSDLFSKSVPIVSNATIVLIVAYMRTGSTLTGSLFQEYPGNFYAFEPIRAVYDTFLESKRRNMSYTVLDSLYGKR